MKIRTQHHDPKCKNCGASGIETYRRWSNEFPRESGLSFRSLDYFARHCPTCNTNWVDRVEVEEDRPPVVPQPEPVVTELKRDFNPEPLGGGKKRKRQKVRQLFPPKHAERLVSNAEIVEAVRERRAGRY